MARQRVMDLVEGRTPAPPPPESNSKPPRPPVRRLLGEAPAAAQHDAPAPIERDPCFKCGTRGDIGCKHRRAA